MTYPQLAVQACKHLITAHNSEAATSAGPTNKGRSASAEIVARCANILLADVRQACSYGGVPSQRRLCMCAALVSAEVLPQAARWHRRDLAPYLIAAWRAALRAIAPQQSGPARGAAAGHGSAAPAV